MSLENPVPEGVSRSHGSGKTWVEKIELEVLANRQTDATLMTYTNQPPRNPNGKKD